MRTSARGQLPTTAQVPDPSWLWWPRRAARPSFPTRLLHKQGFSVKSLWTFEIITLQQTDFSILLLFNNVFEVLDLSLSHVFYCVVLCCVVLCCIFFRQWNVRESSAVGDPWSGDFAAGTVWPGMGCCRQLTTYLNNLYIKVCLVSRLQVSRPLLMSPLLEASPVPIKGDSRGDLLGASDHVKGLRRGKGHAQKSSSGWPSPCSRGPQSAPGAHLRPPLSHPWSYGKELWVSRWCISQENLPLSHSLFTSQFSDFLNRSTPCLLPPYSPIFPSIT